MTHFQLFIQTSELYQILAVQSSYFKDCIAKIWDDWEVKKKVSYPNYWDWNCEGSFSLSQAHMGKYSGLPPMAGIGAPVYCDACAVYVVATSDMYL